MTKVLKVDGMTCGHCVMHVGDALRSIENVSDVEVDLDTGKATVGLADQVDDQRFKDAVAEAGYSVSAIS